MPFKLDRFLSECLAAVADPEPERAVREILTTAVSDAGSVQQALGIPQRAGIQRLYVADNLTVINVIWAPRMTLMPHNHNKSIPTILRRT